ncbi:hypothetical protein WN943_028291 [Citrus x changshan-huyou]
MTVRETIDFFARCQGAGHRAEILMEVIKREKLVGISPDPDADAYMKSIPGVLKIKANYNPTTWMLEVSSKAIETQLGVDFAQIYRDSTWENKQLLKQLSSPSVQRISIFLPVCIKMVGSSSTHASGNGTDVTSKVVDTGVLLISHVLGNKWDVSFSTRRY